MINALVLSMCLTGSHCKVVQRQVVVPQYAVAAQTYYFVGAPLRVESLVQQQLRADGDYQEFLEFKAWKAGKVSSQVLNQEATPAQPMTAVKHHCARCHGKADPDGGFFLDGEPGIEATTITQAIRMIGSNKMPKDRVHSPLTREEKNELVGDLLRLEFQPAAEPDAELPPPEPGEESK